MKTLVLSAAMIALGLASAPAAWAQPTGSVAARNESSCAARYKTEHPNPKDRSTAGQQAYVTACTRKDLGAENSGATGGHEQADCAAEYKKAHPDWHDRSTAGQQAYVSQCMRATMGERGASPGAR